MASFNSIINANLQVAPKQSISHLKEKLKNASGLYAKVLQNMINKLQPNKPITKKKQTKNRAKHFSRDCRKIRKRKI